MTRDAVSVLEKFAPPQLGAEPPGLRAASGGWLSGNPGGRANDRRRLPGAGLGAGIRSGPRRRQAGRASFQSSLDLLGAAARGNRETEVLGGFLWPNIVGSRIPWPARSRVAARRERTKTRAGAISRWTRPRDWAPIVRELSPGPLRSPAVNAYVPVTPRAPLRLRCILRGTAFSSAG